MRAIFIHRKAGAFRCQFEKHAAGFREVNRLEPEAIDHGRRTRAVFRDAFAHLELVRLIVDAPGEMMNAARAPRAAIRCRLFTKVDVRSGFSATHAVTMPAVLRPEMRETHRVGKK